MKQQSKQELMVTLSKQLAREKSFGPAQFTPWDTMRKLGYTAYPAHIECDKKRVLDYLNKAPKGKANWTEKNC